MSFFCWMAHPTRRRPVASAFIAAMIGIGIYYESTATAMAGQFVNQAQGGVNFGNSLLLGGQDDAASGAGQQEMQGFAGSNPTPGESGASSYYLSDNVGLTPGNSINQADSANAALMSDPSCPNGWPQPLDSFQSTGLGAVQRAQSVCQTALNAESASIEAAESSGSNPAYTDAMESIHNFGTSLADVHSAGNALLTTCAPDINNQYQYAPACNLLSRSGVPSLSGLGDTWAGTLNNVTNACRDLPTSITSPAAAESLSTTLGGMTTEADSLIGQTTGTAQVGDNGSVALSSNYANTTTASQQYQEIYGQCNVAQSYLENISTYPGGMNSYTTDPMLNEFLANPANQGMINKMMPFIESNPSVFSQYYQNVACTNNNLDIANSGTSSTSVSTTSTSAPSVQSNPVACDEPLSTYTSTGWIDAADWPDPNAQWIYGTTGGCQSAGGVPNGQTDMMEGTYSNTTGATINATLYFAADDQGVVDINGTQVGSYDDQGQSGSLAYPSTGGVVSVPVTLAPGPDEILFYITNDDTSTTAANPSAGILSIIGDVNGTNQVLIDTNSNWLYTPTNGSSSSGTVTVNPGQTVTGTNPNTHAQSILCNSPIKCMGTQCHALFGNQDLHFSEAMTALSALQQMEQGMQCATGTSVAAGNCQPIIFQGKADYCRTWPFGGTFTNNCCKEGLQSASNGPNLGQYLSLGTDAWSAANNSELDANVSVFGDFHAWNESVYHQFDTWASDGWRYVSGAFKGAAQSVENAFGLGGTTAANSAGGALATAGSDAANEFSNAGIMFSKKASQGLISGIESQVEGWLRTQATNILAQFVGQQEAQQLVQDFVADVIPVIGWIMLAYEVFQILQIIAQILTSCKSEEFKLGEKRKVHECQNLGTYCTEKFLGFCLEHKDVFCCYGSPLDRIIASQIKIGQPNVAGGYGTPKNPNCSGFTPQQLGNVDWNDVSLSAWTAMLQQAGLTPGSNAAGAAKYTPGQIDHPDGNVNANLAPQPVEE